MFAKLLIRLLCLHGNATIMPVADRSGGGRWAVEVCKTCGSKSRLFVLP